jgi:hypothetical protein
MHLVELGGVNGSEMTPRYGKPAAPIGRGV